MIKDVSLSTINSISYLQPISRLTIWPILTAIGLLTIISAAVVLYYTILCLFWQFSHHFSSNATISFPIFESSPPSAADPTISQSHDTFPAS